MKRILSALCVLIILTATTAVGVAQGQEALILSATVCPNTEVALKAPATGELRHFSLKAGDVVPAGETLFTVEPVKVYAEIDGTVAGVYAGAGESADAATARYGAVMQLEYEDRYILECSEQTGYNSEENRDLFVGTPVYLRSANERHFADGVITEVSGGGFVVSVLGGDLVYTQDVKVYRQSDYDNRTLLARAKLKSIPPYGVHASGTVVELAVARGDKVRAGDFLLSYVPDVLEPEQRKRTHPTALEAEEDWVILSVSAQQGASVQKGQLLAVVCPVGDYRLEAQAKESELRDLQIGDRLTARFEEAGAPTVEATLTATSALGVADGDESRYTVYFSLEPSEGMLLGMHATLER
ncbi:MAG: HlyD family efflux transporter periplasmic adaptor subunit [Eubacteriales bacterium]|nr:HlyD family efflux transporter periplasmic adaptor subunit [Eubacteriales bacterium]